MINMMTVETHARAKWEKVWKGRKLAVLRNVNWHVIHMLVLPVKVTY